MSDTTVTLQDGQTALLINARGGHFCEDALFWLLRIVVSIRHAHSAPIVSVVAAKPR